MSSISKPSSLAYNAWPHRVAVALVYVVFPVIWMGGLVTTYDAGMAVPDWPGTYGYNLFLYPMSTWLAGPWNLFVEHGHRLLAASAGLIAIALLTISITTKSHRTIVLLSVAALVGVILQGVLGGMRVMFDARQIAFVHGCVGPAYFAFCACVAVISSRRWAEVKLPPDGNQSLTRSAIAALCLAYGQLVLGAFLRHPSDDASPRMFQMILLFHVIVGIALAGHILGLAWKTRRTANSQAWLMRPAMALVLLLMVQISLGFATLIAKYGWATWLGGTIFNPGFVVTAKGFWSSMIVTAHVANGSLILAVTAVMTVRSWRLFGAASNVRLPAGGKILGVTA